MGLDISISQLQQRSGSVQIDLSPSSDGLSVAPGVERDPQLYQTGNDARVTEMETPLVVTEPRSQRDSVSSNSQPSLEG